MVNIRVDIPANPDPEMIPPMNFVKMCFDQDPQAQFHLDESHAKCASLRARFPTDRAVLHLSGVIAYIGSNHEAAKRFWAEALIVSPGYEFSLIPLRQILESDDFWSGEDAYIEGIAGGIDQLSTRYLTAARQHFADGDYVKADQLGQRASALKQTSVSSLHDYGVCLEDSQAKRDAGELDAWCTQVVNKYQAYWQSLDADSVRQGLMMYAEVPDRLQFARMVAKEIERVQTDEPTVFELGCFAGINLHLAYQQMDTQQQQKVRLTGLEPNEHAVVVGNEAFPYLDIRQGTHEDLIAGTADVAKRVDICMVSRVFMILHPDLVSAILAHLSMSTDTIIICDDVYNVDGQFPVIRTPPDFCIMHNFRGMLDQAGFDVSNVIMAEVPDRECTGFIVARNRRSGN